MPANFYLASHCALPSEHVRRAVRAVISLRLSRQWKWADSRPADTEALFFFFLSSPARFKVDERTMISAITHNLWAQNVALPTLCASELTKPEPGVGVGENSPGKKWRIFKRGNGVKQYLCSSPALDVQGMVDCFKRPLWRKPSEDVCEGEEASSRRRLAKEEEALVMLTVAFAD